MLAFPKNTMACDLAGRMAKIIDYMGNKCDTVWNQIWGGKVRELVRDSMPSDGSACSSEPIDSSDGKILAQFKYESYNTSHICNIPMYILKLPFSP